MTKKNTRAKERPRDQPYMVWATPDRTWEWRVLKSWQSNDDQPNARWFCEVRSPYTPYGELGDVYVEDIKEIAELAFVDGDCPVCSDGSCIDCLAKANALRV